MATIAQLSAVGLIGKDGLVCFFSAEAETLDTAEYLKDGRVEGGLR
jgi:hypothetical protein